MSSIAFSHGHFACNRKMKGHGSKGCRESRSFERKSKEKAKRHSFWTYNAARKIDRDLRAAQRMFEVVSFERTKTKASARPANKDVHADSPRTEGVPEGQASTADVPEWDTDPYGQMTEESSAEYESDSSEESSASTAASSPAPTPATTPASSPVSPIIDSFGSAVLDNDPVTSLPMNISSPVSYRDQTVLADFAQPIDFDYNYNEPQFYCNNSQNHFDVDGDIDWPETGYDGPLF